MSGYLFDANVLLDIATSDPVWRQWSKRQFGIAASKGPVLINPIIYAEIAPAFARIADLDRWLNPAAFLKLPLPYSAGWHAAQAFRQYRKRGGAKHRHSQISTSAHTPSLRIIPSSRGMRPGIERIFRIWRLSRRHSEIPPGFTYLINPNPASSPPYTTPASAPANHTALDLRAQSI